MEEDDDEAELRLLKIDGAGGLKDGGAQAGTKENRPCYSICDIVELKKLSVCHLSCMSLLACCLECCATAGFAYIPAILLKQGYNPSSMSCFLGIGPLAALLTVPFIGRWSDQCTSRYGRRTPFIVGISLLVLTSLVLIPFSRLIGAWVDRVWNLQHIDLILLTAGVVLLDYSSQAGFTPCEALLSDMLKNTDSCELGFTVYSCMLSVGCCLGYLITAIDWAATDVGSLLGGQEQCVFTVLFLLLLGGLAISLFTTDEKSANPDQQISSIKTSSSNDSLDDLKICDGTNSEDVGYETGGSDNWEPLINTKSELIKIPVVLNINGLDRTITQDQNNQVPKRTTIIINFCNVPKYIYQKILTASKSVTLLSKKVLYSKQSALVCLQCILCQIPFLVVKTLFNLIFRILSVAWRLPISCSRNIKDMFTMPTTLRKLIITNIFGWSALMCHNLFYPDYVGQAVYGGDPNAAEGSVNRGLYDDGVRMGSFGLLLHSILSCFYAAALQDRVIARLGLGKAYGVGMTVFAVAMIGTLSTNNITLINAYTALAGFGFAAITTIPNTLITLYHANKKDYLLGGVVSGEPRGIGTDIALCDSTCLLSQVLLSVFMGSVVQLTGSVSSYIVTGAVLGFMAAYLTIYIVD